MFDLLIGTAKQRKMVLHKGCLLEAPLRGFTLEAEGVGTEGIGAEGVGTEGVGTEGIGAEGIEDRAFQASILGQALDEPGKRCLWRKDENL